MRRKAAIAVTILILAISGVLFLFNETPHSAVQLQNGNRVEFHAITWGTNHIAWHGKMHQRILRFAPPRLLPANWMKGVLQGRFSTPTNAIVLWLRLSGGNSGLRYAITDKDGFGAFASNLEVVSVLPHLAKHRLYPVILTEWPRKAEEIAISFFQEAARADERTRVDMGRLIIENPSRSSAPSFAPRPVPATEKNDGLELSLISLEVLPKGRTFHTRAGSHWACRARFQIFEQGITNQDWVVQSLWLSDPSGNRRHATGLREWNGAFFEIFSDPLWLDEPAWKVEVDLTRRANFRPEETVTLSGVPMPTKTGPEQSAFQTNLLGHLITLRSMRSVQVTSATLGVHSMGAPGFAVELDSSGNDWVPKVVGIRNERGEEMRVPPHGYGEGYAIMRFSGPKDGEQPKSLTVSLTAQRRRTFTFFATLQQESP